MSFLLSCNVLVWHSKLERLSRYPFKRFFKHQAFQEFDDQFFVDPKTLELRLLVMHPISHFLLSKLLSSTPKPVSYQFFNMMTRSISIMTNIAIIVIPQFSLPFL